MLCTATVFVELDAFLTDKEQILQHRIEELECHVAKRLLLDGIGDCMEEVGKKISDRIDKLEEKLEKKVDNGFIKVDDRFDRVEKMIAELTVKLNPVLLSHNFL
jgi:uncharacterized coiled-coil protein SlyX